MDESARFVAVAQKFLTRDGLDVVASAASQREGLEKAIKLRPDVVLVDVTLGRESGFDVGRRLVEDVPDLHPYIVLTSTHDPEDFADLIAECPAVGLPEGPHSAGPFASWWIDRESPSIELIVDSKLPRTSRS